MNKVLDCYKTYEVYEDHKFVTFEVKYMFNVWIKHIFMLKDVTISRGEGRQKVFFSL